MKKRYITSLVAGGLMAAMLPGAALAQTEAEGAVTFGENITCEYGQGSAAVLPACEASEDGTMLTLTFLNPQTRTGPFDGISVLDGTMVGNFAEATFEVRRSSRRRGGGVRRGHGLVRLRRVGHPGRRPAP